MYPVPISSLRPRALGPALTFSDLEEPGEDVELKDRHVAATGEVQGGTQHLHGGAWFHRVAATQEALELCPGKHAPGWDGVGLQLRTEGASNRRLLPPPPQHTLTPGPRVGRSRDSQPIFPWRRLTHRTPQRSLQKVWAEPLVSWYRCPQYFPPGKSALSSACM